MNDERQILAQIENQLRTILSRIPSITSLQIRKDTLFLGRKVDLTVGFEIEGGQKEFIVEVKKTATPKTLRDLCLQWRKSIPEDSENMYPVMAASYLSEASINVCKEFKVGCFDVQGNCYFAFDSLYVEVKGIPNENPSQRSIKSLFSPKSSRVTRVLLSETNRWWQVQEIAKEAQISIGLVSDIKTRLLEEELILGQGKSVRIKDPQKLINLWLENYSYKRNTLTEYYSLDRSSIIEKNIADVCKDYGVKYALALFSGANKIAPFVRMERTFAYIEENSDTIAGELSLKKVTSGANVILLRPLDQGIFYQSRKIDDIQVVSDLQLYLDLKTYKGRGEEAADAILRTNLEPQWSRNLTMNPER